MPQAFSAFCNFSLGNAYTGELGLLSDRRISWRICARERVTRVRLRLMEFGIITGQEGLASMKHDRKSSTQPAASSRPTGSDFDPVPVLLRHYNIPLTRENYLTGTTDPRI